MSTFAVSTGPTEEGRRDAELAETLEYVYLLFAPEALDLDTVVLNTEAHPLRRTW